MLFYSIHLTFVLNQVSGREFHNGKAVDGFRPTYLVAGTQEPFFLENAVRWADALRDNDITVVLEEHDAGHADTMWRAELPKMVAWAFS